MATGFPGYNGMVPRENGFLSEMLLAQGYATLGIGKWHLHARQRVRVRRVEGALAAVARLRALLRLHRRQDQPVGADAGARQPLHRSAAAAGGGLPPQRRPRRPRDRVPHRPAHGRAGQAVLHVLLPGRGPCAASRRAGVDRALSRQVRPRLGPLARGGVRAAARDGHRAAGHEAVAAAAVGEGVGHARRRRAAALRAADGGVRGVPRADRPSHRPRARLPRAARRARQHAGHARLRQRRVGRRRRARLVQREPVRQPRRADDRGEPEAPRRLGQREVVPQLFVGLGVGGQHAAAALEALPAPGRHERPADRALAQGHRRARRGARPVRARRRHHADDPRGARPRAAGAAERRRRSGRSKA